MLKSAMTTPTMRNRPQWSEIPDYFEIEADVTDFELDIDAGSTVDDLQTSILQLSDASVELCDGTMSLYDGIQELSAGTASLNDGINQLLTAHPDYAQGVPASGNLNEAG